MSKLPILKKKLRLLGDWSIGLVFHSDISMIKGYVEESHDNKIKKDNNNNRKNYNNKSKTEITFDKTKIKMP